MIWSIDYDSEDLTIPALPSDGGSCSKCKAKTGWDEHDPMDLSDIKRLAAIGDSYSAGIGAGDRLGSVFQAFEPQSGESAINELVKFYTNIK